jgi:hypothetical protein
MAGERLRAPLAVLLLLAAFAQMSCVTAMLWSSGPQITRTEPLPVAVVETCTATDASGKLTGFALRLGDETGPLGTDAAHQWLVLVLTEPAPVAAFVDAVRHGQVDDARLDVVLPAASLPVRDADLQLRGRLAGAAPIAPPDLSFDGGYCRASSRCHARLATDLERAPAPWPGAPATLGREVHEQTGVAGKILLTPFTVAVDVVTSPLQLIGLVWINLMWKG